jgi:MFS family permease
MAGKTTRIVWILSLVSLFTDMASEMLYPIMPLYLKQIGFTVIGIGIIEGFAEAIAGLSKGYFGKWSDSIGKRLPFVQLGYTLSALSKPMMAVLTYPWWIFTARSVDRIGKGIRTGARDALLSDEATPQTKGTVFGFHRSMDTLGAAIGPAIALVFLYYYPGEYKTLFLVAFIPGLLAITASLLLQEKKQIPSSMFNPKSFFAFIGYWRNSNSQYRKFVTSLLVFALVNSSDVFLLLQMKSAGVSDTTLIAIYIFYNGVYALVAYPVGIVADKLGLKKMFIAGLMLFVIVYAGMAFANEIWMFVVLFFLYGLYAAATEGIAKAWISNIVSKKETATAIGTYSGFQSIAALIASTFAGVIWYTSGASTLFAAAALITFLVILYITFKVQKPVYVES